MWGRSERSSSLAQVLRPRECTWFLESRRFQGFKHLFSSEGSPGAGARILGSARLEDLRGAPGMCCKFRV